MFRLIKLGIYAMLGYFIYEMYVGMTSAPAEKRRSEGQGKGGHSKQGGANMTGRGRGKRVQTEDADGASESHVVGRGVVS